MDRVNSRISQAYGYAVCLITVIVMLIERPAQPIAGAAPAGLTLRQT